MAARGWRVVVGIAVVSALVGAGCSSDDGSSEGGSSGATSTSAPDASVLGPEMPASGEPLRVGYIYAGQAQSQDNTNELTIAQATVDYANEHLGGVAGRPLELEVCEDMLTPAGATDCANQMVAADVPVVLASTPANPAPILEVLEPAGIPFFNVTGADQTALFSDDAYVLNNPMVIVAAPLKIAEDAGVEHVTMVHVDVPAAAQLPAIGKTMFEDAGIELTATAVPLGTPDVTPQIQAAISDGAEQFIVIGDTSLCVGTLKALKTLGFEGTVASNENCLTGDAAEAVPGGYDGLVVPMGRSIDPNEPDNQLLDAIAATYAPGTPTGTEGQAFYGFEAVLGFVRAMTDLKPDDATAAGIDAAFRSMETQPLPLLSSQTFQCNHEASTLTPAVCSNAGAIATIDPSGDIVGSETFDATPYLP